MLPNMVGKLNSFLLRFSFNLLIILVHLPAFLYFVFSMIPISKPSRSGCMTVQSRDFSMLGFNLIVKFTQVSKALLVLSLKNTLNIHPFFGAVCCVLLILQKVPNNKLHSSPEFTKQNTRINTVAVSTIFNPKRTALRMNTESGLRNQHGSCQVQLASVKRSNRIPS